MKPPCGKRLPDVACIPPVLHVIFQDTDSKLATQAQVWEEDEKSKAQSSKNQVPCGKGSLEFQS